MATPLTDAFPLVLGSASPRRREILTILRLPHVVVAADADESPRPAEGPEAYLERVAAAKLEAVRLRLAAEPTFAALRTAAAVLVADTTVVDGTTMLGKPRDRAEAEAMIERLGGRTHGVATRFVVGAVGVGGAVLHGETVWTRVTFRALRAGEAAAYAATGEGLDKAGAYGIQGLASGFVTRIEGSYPNVVGLPAAELVVALQGLGLL